DYGLHPGIPNNGEDNFLLAHLFVGASHSGVRVIPDEEEQQGSMGNRECGLFSKLRCSVATNDVDKWLVDRKLDQVLTSEYPALPPLLAQLTIGGGRVSPTRVRDFVHWFNIGLNRSLSPGAKF
ncbi:unnamed protein product, partial [Ectocarpus sp. 12 AP-2014]